MIESPEQEARIWLQSVLELMGMSAPVEIAASPETSKDARQQWLEISESALAAPHRALLLDRDGEALDALQYLLNAAMHLSDDRQQMYTIEMAGLRSGRQQQLATMAWDAAEKVRSTGQEFIFSNLNAAERRQIHVLLHDEPDLDTFSRGKEPDRRLVVCLKGEASEESEP